MKSFDEEFEKFADVSRKYTSEVLKSKSDGKKVVCSYGSYVPLEIIHSSGAAPYVLFDGGDPEPPDAALPYLLFCINVQARFQVGQHEMKLNPITPIADLIIIDTKESDSVRVGSVFEYLNLPVKKLGVPQDWEKEIAFDYYKRRLGELKKDLEELTGEEISDDKLIESISKYNRMRELLGEIGSLRKESPPPLGGEEFIKLNHYALRSDPDVAIDCLEKILETLKGKSRFPADAPRVMVAGRGFAFGDYALPRMVERSGGVIVSDFLEEGVLHPWEVKVNGNPLESIAQSYYREKIPSCLFNPSWTKRWEYISKLIDEYNVDGLLYYLLAFDVIYDYESAIFSKKADEKGVPSAMIESAYDFSREATETLRTRVESFINICRR